MKNFKKIFICIILIMVTFCSVCLTGCFNNSGRSITNITLSNSQGLVDTYTISYSDGTTSTFTVTNGKNGTNGTNSNITIQDLFNEYKTQYGEITYDEFLQMYLSYNSDDMVGIINQSLLSSAKVYTEFYESSMSYNWWGQALITKNVAVYTGSSVIWQIDNDYTYFVTNYHVVYSENANADNGSSIARKISLYLYGSESCPIKSESTDSNGYDQYTYDEYRIEGTYVGGSATYDLAVVKARTSDVKNINPNVKAITCASSYYVGQTAIAIGNTEDEGISATKGIISIDDEYINLEIGTTRSYRSIRIDTSIYAGNSGGGLFNSEGKLIGITNAGDTEDENINYAIPVSIVKNTVENILYFSSTKGYDHVYKITLGLTLNAKNSKFVYDYNLGYGKIIEDITIGEIAGNSIASQMNLEDAYIIKSLVINGNENILNRSFNLGDLLLTLRAGDSIKIKYTQNGSNDVLESLSYTIKESDLSIIE